MGACCFLVLKAGSVAETRYSVTDQEWLAVVEAVSRQ